MESDFVFPLADAMAALPDSAHAMRFHYALRHGSMKFGLYAASGADSQTPHEQDELYIVISGNGIFIRGGDRRAFVAGDAIFVEAGVNHRFEGISDDFVTWVIFWGPEGGEVAITPGAAR